MTAPTFPAGSLVRARGRDWLVIPGGSDGMLRARPLGGSDAETTLLLPEFDHPTPAVFTPPTVDDRGDASRARLLRDGLRLSFQATGGPFRSFAKLGVTPRNYQLVPLMMAAAQDTTRLLIADGVGIGKTVEAGLIVTELLATGDAGAHVGAHANVDRRRVHQAVDTGTAQGLELPSPEHAIHDAGVILQRDEDRIALAGALAHQHQPGHAGEAPLGARGDFRRRAGTLSRKERAQQRHGMAFEREPQGLVIGGDMLAERHLRQVGIRLLAQFLRGHGSEERQRVIIGQAPHRPERRAAIQPHGAEGIGIGQRAHRAAMQARAPLAPVSPAYSVMSQDHAKLRYVFDAIDTDDPATVGCMLAQVEAEAQASVELWHCPDDPPEESGVVFIRARDFASYPGPTRGAALVAAMRAIKGAK